MLYEVITVERHPYQYLYNDDLGYHFMHAETFEQLSLDAAMISSADLLKEGTTVEIPSYNFV